MYDPRRRSPGWVRSMTSKEVHAVALKFRRDQEHHDLTEAQEWLWGALISELEYRHRNTKPAWQRCACELCVAPF